jgi:hypothetical protein
MRSLWLLNTAHLKSYDVLRKEKLMQINNLKDFLENYGPGLAERIDHELEVIHDPLRDRDEELTAFMSSLKKNVSGA